MLKIVGSIVLIAMMFTSASSSHDSKHGGKLGKKSYNNWSSKSDSVKGEMNKYGLSSNKGQTEWNRDNKHKKKNGDKGGKGKNNKGKGGKNKSGKWSSKSQKPWKQTPGPTKKPTAAISWTTKHPTVSTTNTATPTTTTGNPTLSPPQCPPEQPSNGDNCAFEGDCPYNPEVCNGLIFYRTTCQCDGDIVTCSDGAGCVVVAAPTPSPIISTTTGNPTTSPSPAPPSGGCPPEEPFDGGICEFEGECTYRQICCGEEISTDCFCNDGQTRCAQIVCGLCITTSTPTVNPTPPVLVTPSPVTSTTITVNTDSPTTSTTTSTTTVNPTTSPLATPSPVTSTTTTSTDSPTTSTTTGNPTTSPLKTPSPVIPSTTTSTDSPTTSTTKGSYTTTSFTLCPPVEPNTGDTCAFYGDCGYRSTICNGETVNTYNCHCYADGKFKCTDIPCIDTSTTKPLETPSPVIPSTTTTTTDIPTRYPTKESYTSCPPLEPNTGDKCSFYGDISDCGYRSTMCNGETLNTYNCHCDPDGEFKCTDNPCIATSTTRKPKVTHVWETSMPTDTY